MESATHKKQKPLYLLVLMCTVLLLVIVVGLFMIKNSATSPTSQKTASTTPECIYDDHVCLFLEKLRDPNMFYDMPMTATISVTNQDKPTGQVVLAADTKNNVYITSSESGKIQSELLVIGGTLYKKTPTGTWQQQEGADSATFLQFRQKALSEATMQGKTTTYSLIGEEDCGTLYCFKYLVRSPKLGNTKEYILFDRNEYLLRKVINQTGNTTTETTFSYTPIQITPPTE